MPPYDIFFFGIVFFLLGVLLASLELKVLILVIVALLAAVFLTLRFFLKNKRFFWFCGLSFFVILGAIYYEADNQQFLKVQIPFDEKTEFLGVISNQPTIKNNSQEFYLELVGPERGKILVKAPLYPGFNYGDRLKIAGTIQKPFSASYEKYLAKEGVSGVVSFAEIEFLEKSDGNVFKSFLFKIRTGAIAIFQKLLPPKEAAFLTGLTLGGRSEFSDEFKEAMSKSGTTHLVALSGYNITVIAWALMGVFTQFLRRRAAFIFTVFIIVGFVLMAGAEASVVRAAIMGILVLLARDIGRIFDFRNAIAFSALVMVLVNPKVLVFDIGFQLSFLALLGIIYLRPAIIKLFRLSAEPGFLSWKDNLLTTFSAQLAVLPILVLNFGSFSLTSLLANVLVLETVPVAMALGFSIAGLGLISYSFAWILSWPALIILKFEIFVIELFAKLSLPISPNFNFVLTAIYYLLIAFLIIYVQRIKFRAVQK